MVVSKGRVPSVRSENPNHKYDEKQDAAESDIWMQRGWVGWGQIQCMAQVVGGAQKLKHQEQMCVAQVKRSGGRKGKRQDVGEKIMCGRIE